MATKKLDETVLVLCGIRYKMVGETRREIVRKWSKDGKEKTVPVVSSGWISKDEQDALNNESPDHCDIDPNGNPWGTDDGERFCLFLNGRIVQLRTEDRVIVIRPENTDE